MDRDGARILIVDDEQDLCDLLFRLLKREGFTPTIAHEGESALEMIQLGVPDVVLLDIRMRGIDGMEVLRRSKALKVDLPVIMMTGYGGVHGAVDSIKAGAYDYLTKPIDHAGLVRSIRGALAHRDRKRKKRDPAKTVPHLNLLELQKIMGPSDAVRRIVSEIALVAQSNFTVIIQGETGCGKELVARTLHGVSSRAGKPMVAVDCGAICETLFESECFGHEKGAFTGASFAKPGKFELAQGGTLFLDEIGNLPFNSQIKLLRSIQERSFFRVGGQTPVEVDVRLLAATNRDLNIAVQKGSFSRDLFYRLTEFTIVIPPLRERREDILHLAGRFLDATNVELGKKVKGLSQAAIDSLLSYSWPGNVRQLKASVRRAVLQAQDLIDPEHLLLEDPSAAACESHVKTQDLGWVGLPLREIVRRSTEEVEKQVLIRALRKTGGNKAKAARLLQIDYKTIHTKVKQYGINTQEEHDGQKDEKSD